DLGTFLARLDVQALEGVMTADDATRAGESLVDGYAAAGGMPSGVTDQRARALFALATESFRERQPGWPQRAEAILEHIDSLLSAPRRSSEEHLTSGLQGALDPEKMRHPLADALGSHEPFDLQA